MKYGAIFISKILFTVLYQLYLFFIQLIICDCVFHLIIQYGLEKKLEPTKKTLGVNKLPSTYKVKTNGIQTDQRRVRRGDRKNVHCRKGKQEKDNDFNI